MEIIFWVMITLAGMALYGLGCAMGDDDANN